jgi:DNA-binding transcriptional ArsR family regulator
MNKCTCDSFFTNFANKTRLNIMILLRHKSCDVSEICKQLNLEQSLVSHNLKLLLNCNLVESKRNGKSKLYSLNKKITLPIIEIYEKNILKNHCSICKLKKK